MLLSVIFAACALISLVLTIWQFIVAWRFPLHRRAGRTGFTPDISVLKPLKDVDARTEECLRSWFQQEYPGRLQILFGVAAADDPVCGLVRRLIAEHPAVDAELILCGERLGANAKVSQLAQLARHARHRFIAVSDADVWAPPDCLANAADPLRDPKLGLVSCLYRFGEPENLAMRWEAFAVNADFWSQVLQSRSLRPMDFGLGAAMLMSRAALEQIGGFAAMADYLADDYQLGRRIAGAGFRVTISPIVVECRAATMNPREVFLHQVRWSRTIRACQPVGFFLTILSAPAFWPALWLALQPSFVSAAGAAVCLLARAGGGIFLEGRMTGRCRLGSAGMAIAKDFLQVLMWMLAYTGRRILWRGITYRVTAGGRLETLDAPGNPPLGVPEKNAGAA